VTPDWSDSLIVFELPMVATSARHTCVISCDRYDVALAFVHRQLTIR